VVDVAVERGGYQRTGVDQEDRLLGRGVDETGEFLAAGTHDLESRRPGCYRR